MGPGGRGGYGAWARGSSGGSGPASAGAASANAPAAAAASSGEQEGGRPNRYVIRNLFCSSEVDVQVSSKKDTRFCGWISLLERVLCKVREFASVLFFRFSALAGGELRRPPGTAR